MTNVTKDEIFRDFCHFLSYDTKSTGGLAFDKPPFLWHVHIMNYEPQWNKLVCASGAILAGGLAFIAGAVVGWNVKPDMKTFFRLGILLPEKESPRSHVSEYSNENPVLQTKKNEVY